MKFQKSGPPRAAPARAAPHNTQAPPAAKSTKPRAEATGPVSPWDIVVSKKPKKTVAPGPVSPWDIVPGAKKRKEREGGQERKAAAARPSPGGEEKDGAGARKKAKKLAKKSAEKENKAKKDPAAELAPSATGTARAEDGEAKGTARGDKGEAARASSLASLAAAKKLTGNADGVLGAVGAATGCLFAELDLAKPLGEGVLAGLAALGFQATTPVQQVPASPVGFSVEVLTPKARTIHPTP